MERYELYDGCYGSVLERCSNGVFVELDNGEIAFANHFQNLRSGTKVLCTVERMEEGFRRKVVTIDSFIKYMPYYNRYEIGA